MSKLINNLERLMKARNLTQKALALKAGLNETAVRDILKGRSKDPQLSTLRALARVLGCSVEDIFKGTATPPTYGVAEGQGTWSGPTPKKEGESSKTETLFVEELDITDSKGPAALVDGRTRNPIGTWQIPSDILDRRRFSGMNRDLALIRVEGDSMAPEFNPGDWILVNTGDSSPSPPGLFVVWDGDGFVLRRCEIKPNTKPVRLVMRARNSEYGTYEVNLKDVVVCGRVAGRWQKF